MENDHSRNPGATTGSTGSDASSSGRIHPGKHFTGDGLAYRGFQLIERLLLIVVAVMTMAAAGHEVWGVYQSRSINLADILLMFLYTEVIGMTAVFYTGRGSPFVYPIFIAVTALARLIVLQGKEMAPENILFEAGSILLLGIAAVIIVKGTET